MARFKLEFWLDGGKDDEMLLLDEIAMLKRRRSFASTLRDGIRLVVELKAGKTDLLFQMFPWVKDTLKPAPPPPDNDDLLRKIEKLLKDQRSPVVFDNDGKLLMAGEKKVGSPQALTVGKVALPRFDDDENTVVIKKSTSNDAGQNFLNAAFGLQQ